MCRYVDNRLVLCDSSVPQVRAMREFLHPAFYGASIELEEVTDHSFLGFRVCMRSRTVEYQQPTSPWQIRHYSSAGSMKIRTAGFYSRQAALRVRLRCKFECKDFRLKEASCFAFSLLRFTGSALLHSLSTLCVRAHHPLISSSCLPPISFTHACTTKTRSVHLPSFLILSHTCSSPLHVTVLSL